MHCQDRCCCTVFSLDDAAVSIYPSIIFSVECTRSWVLSCPFGSGRSALETEDYDARLLYQRYIQMPIFTTLLSMVSLTDLRNKIVCNREYTAPHTLHVYL